jgi:uncharacterized membrane protein YedE/YeeE
MQKLSAAFAGLLFGGGLTISGMVNPMKVLNFLDLSGAFDPTLIFVMGGGLLTALVGYQLLFRIGKPLLAERFDLPGTKLIDARLVGGAALFGVGWGISGICPGPAVAGLVFGNSLSFIFVTAMAAGIIGARLLSPGKSNP